MSQGGMAVVGGSHLRGFKGVAGESRLRPLLVAPDTTTRYFQRLRNDDFIYELVVWNPVGPWKVSSEGPAYFNAAGILLHDLHYWGCRETAPDEITFYPHPAYTGGPISIHYDRTVCRPHRLYAEPTTSFTFLEATTHEQRVRTAGGSGQSTEQDPLLGAG